MIYKLSLGSTALLGALIYAYTVGAIAADGGGHVATTEPCAQDAAGRYTMCCYTGNGGYQFACSNGAYSNPVGGGGPTAYDTCEHYVESSGKGSAWCMGSTHQDSQHVYPGYVIALDCLGSGTCPPFEYDFKPAHACVWDSETSTCLTYDSTWGANGEPTLQAKGVDVSGIDATPPPPG